MHQAKADRLEAVSLPEIHVIAFLVHALHALATPINHGDS
jgi:hypothetical protein